MMTVGKAAALTVGFVGAVALGVAISPSVRDGMSDIANRTNMTSASKAPSGATEQVRPAAAQRATRATPASVPTAKADAPPAIAANAVRADEPRVQERLKPVLNRGANMEIAAKGFLTAEEFATVAHAARNTQVPFMVLKHRVMTEKQPMTQSVAAAIREFKPELDAKAEVARAQRQAREDLAAISS
jgi:hypothetical protein